MDPLHIVQVTPFFGSKNYGGTERYVNQLSKELAERGHVIDVFTTKKSTKIPYQSYFKNMTVHRFFSPWDVFGINPACFMLHKMLQLDKVDVFHVHSYIYFTTIQAAIAKFFKKTPMLLHIHGGVGRPPYKTGFIKEFAKLFYDFTFGKFVLTQADLIASVSIYDTKLLTETMNINSSRIVMVNNAIDPSSFPEITQKRDKEIVFTYIGDLEPWKGIPYYSRVVQRVLKKTKNVSFNFVGYGSLFNDLKEKFAKVKRVTVYGAVDHSEIPKILSKTNFLVQPSYWEGSPTTIIEAMAMGVPIVASNIGDVPRLLNNGKHGTMFEAGNEKELENTLLEIMGKYGDLFSVAKLARQKIRRDFSFSTITDQIEKLYYKLASR